MAASRLSDAEVQRLADDVRAKILAKAPIIAEAEGEIQIRIFLRNPGFDIKVAITTV